MSTGGDGPGLSAGGASRLAALLGGLDRLGPILALPEHPAAADPPLPFGRYRLRARLGAGAHGAVLLAEADGTGPAAVKVPLPEVLVDPELRARFVREGRLAVGLDHPGVVPVLEAGECDGLPFLATGYVAGPTLAAWLAEHPGPAPPAAAARLAAALAAAVQYAHERGVLHCDLTPANVLLRPVSAAPATIDDFAPLVTDFGLARALSGAPGADQSRSVWVVGTARSMAPEQARGDRHGLTARTDVWALGVILYQLLAGAPPFDGRSPPDVLARVLTRPPAPVAAAAPGVPRDLAAVCLRCLEKAPGDRYASAAALAADLHRFLAGRPTRARPLGPVGAAARWARRRPALAAAVALAAAAWALVPALGVWFADRLGAEADARAAAEARAREQAFYATLERVRQRRAAPAPGWGDENLADLRALAAAVPDPALLPDLRSEAAEALAAADLRPVGALGVGFAAYAPAYAPDGRTVALCGWRWDAAAREGRVLLADAATGRTARELRFPIDPAWAARAGAPDGCRCVRFSPDGRWLVAGTRGGQLARWDLAAPGAGPAVWAAHAADAPDRETWVTALAFSADGRTLYSSCRTATRVWDAAAGWAPVGGRREFVLPGGAPVVSDTFPVHEHCPAGGRTVCRFDARSGAARPTGVRSGESLGATRDGGLAALTRYPDGALVLAAPDPGAPAQPLTAPGRSPGEPAHATQLGFDPAGGVLVTTEEHARRLKVWDVAAGRLVADRATDGGSGRFAFSPDGRRLAVAEGDRTAVYELTGGARETLAVGPRWWAGPAAVRPDGRVLAVLHADPQGDPELSTWDAPPGAPAVRTGGRELGVPGSRLPAAAHAADGRFAFATARGGPERWRPLGRLWAGDGAGLDCEEVSDLRFGPDGRLWAAEAHRVRALAVPGWAAEVALENDPAARAAGLVFRAVAPGRRLTAVGRRDGDVFLLRPGGPPGPPVRAVGSAVTALALSADEAEVLVGGERGELVALGAEGGPPRPVPGAHRDAVTAIAAGPGGWAATASADRTVRLWDAARAPVLTLRFGGPVRQAAVSADGRLLTVLVGGERGVRRWRLDRLAAELRALGLPPGWPAAD